MKAKPAKIIELLAPLIDETRHVIIPESRTDKYFDFVPDPKSRRQFQSYSVVFSDAVRAILELHSVYEDLLTCYKMARRYPWRGTSITRSQHLQFVWVQFVNQCYLFREKYKLVLNQVARVSGKPLSVAAGLKVIDKQLGRFIRARGQHFHEWFEHNQHVRFFSLVEFINASKPMQGPLGDVQGHYQDAKWWLSTEIEEAVLFAESFFKENVRGQIQEVTRVLKTFNDVVDRLRRATS